MSVLKYKDPVTGEVKKVGAPKADTYSMAEMDAKLDGKAPAYTCGTSDLTAGVSNLETEKLYFVYE